MHWINDCHSGAQEVSCIHRWNGFQEEMAARHHKEALAEIIYSGMLHLKMLCSHSLLWVPFNEAKDLILTPFFKAEHPKLR